MATATVTKPLVALKQNAKPFRCSHLSVRPSSSIPTAIPVHSRDLFEAAGFTGYAPNEDRPRVDKVAGIIYRAKLLGRESTNTHKDQAGPGVTQGTRYMPSAIQEELDFLKRVGPLPVNLNHPDVEGRAKRLDRDAEDRLGQVENYFLYEGEIYGDLHLLLSHPMTPRLLEAAERMPGAFAISHNARGDGPVRNGWWEIETVKIVKSFDVVADGGTTKSLFESQESAKVAIKLKDLLAKPENASKWPKTRKLLEICPTAGEMLLESEADGGDYRDHLHMAKKMCEDAGDTETAGKIHKLMAPPKDKEEDESEEDEIGGEEPKPAEKKEEKKTKKPEAAMESRLHELEAKDECRTLCESLQFQPSAVQLRAMMPLSKSDRKAFVEELKTTATKAAKKGPQSRSLMGDPNAAGGGKTGPDGKPLVESSIPTVDKPDEMAAWLRS
jgi:hypothetical protein